jgi:hypothetical protein
MNGANIGEALVVAGQELARANEGVPVRRRPIVMLLADSVPTIPRSHAPGWAAAAAVALKDHGIQLVMIVMGEEAEHNREYFEKVSGWSNAMLRLYPEPGHVAAVLPRTRLHAVSRVWIHNETTGRPARAVRLLADGSLGGVIELAPGRNQLRIEVESDQGERQRLDRWVVHAPAVPRTRGERDALLREMKQFTRRMRDRTVETEIIEIIERARQSAEQGLRQVDIEAED